MLRGTIILRRLQVALAMALAEQDDHVAALQHAKLIDRLPRRDRSYRERARRMGQIAAGRLRVENGLVA